MERNKYKILRFSIFQFFNLLIFQSFSQSSLDQLNYNYNANNNQLNYIIDEVGSIVSTDDLDNQILNNYRYDLNGQLSKDAAEGILEIKWTISGKVKQVSIDDSEPNDGIADRTLEFKYDALGNRIKKTETIISSSESNTTYYLRNASGELISSYKDNGTTLTRDELCITGGTNNAEEYISTDGVFTRKTGTKKYEIKDHLGSVRAVVTDEMTFNTSLTTHNPQLTTTTDYYSYGSPLSGRLYNSSNYNYGYQGKLKDDELKGNGNSYDFGARMLDVRVGRWLSIDPVVDYSRSPYNSMANNPIVFIDLDGRMPAWAIVNAFILRGIYDTYKQSGLSAAVGEVLTFSDADDPTVLATAALPNTVAMHTDGQVATKMDIGLAGVGFLVPVVAGSVIGKVARHLIPSHALSKYFERGGAYIRSIAGEDGFTRAQIEKISEIGRSMQNVNINEGLLVDASTGQIIGGTKKSPMAGIIYADGTVRVGLGHEGLTPIDEDNIIGAFEILVKDGKQYIVPKSGTYRKDLTREVQKRFNRLLEDSGATNVIFLETEEITPGWLEFFDQAGNSLPDPGFN